MDIKVIKTEEDLKVADLLMQSLSVNHSNYKVQYDDIVTNSK